eukprot:CAMPEP_0201184740 /NCGR_PEP_ID=MMETSP0851-20130426/126981_1 /ASSEMBLY_ACC=CAM_ASM_000631 /TAXON_ID=183588 /ORGANISM="Pseudo-nitzschia fraudulenta, Strain WWA7" /LENGTH=87 /DNA_ID=CAMNT_0047469779 /DNA_START=39 /DNA_END=302 /DNA_ORIENTATION=-
MCLENESVIMWEFLTNECSTVTTNYLEIIGHGSVLWIKDAVFSLKGPTMKSTHHGGGGRWLSGQQSINALLSTEFFSSYCYESKFSQ